MVLFGHHMELPSEEAIPQSQIQNVQLDAALILLPPQCWGGGESEGKGVESFESRVGALSLNPAIVS